MSPRTSFHSSENKQFWEERARDIGDTVYAASNDPNLKTLELRFLDRVLPREGVICEIGCGNGYNIRHLDRAEAVFHGFDYSDEMIALAKKYDQSADHHYDVEDLLEMTRDSEFDAIFTDRCLINLPSHAQQLAGVENMFRAIRPGGLVVIIEQSVEKLERVNAVRTSFRLPPISEPAFNVYVRRDEIVRLAEKRGTVVSVDSVSGTYYFLSRVVNALVKRDRARYGDVLNRLGTWLPQVGSFGTLFALVARKARDSRAV